MVLSVQTSFVGGEWSKRSQGRFDTPEYKTALNLCRNGLATEEGAWTRRPGTRHAGHTKGGKPGRITRYDFNALSPYQLEFTDNALRFRAFDSFVFDTTATVTAISAAGVFTTSADHGWFVGDEVMVSGLGTVCPQIQNRQLAIATVPSSTTFTVVSTISGNAPVVEAFSGSATAKRIMALSTSYATSAWQKLNVIRQGTDAIFLNGDAPKQLKVLTQPGPNSPGSFRLQNAYFQDGPYLDTVSNGATLTPSATSGNIGFACAFQTYAAAKLYKTGDCVTSSSVNYISLVDNNVGNTPASSPTYWAAGTASDILGVTSADVGRLIRLFSGSAWTWAQITSVQNQVSVVDPAATFTGYGTMSPNSVVVDGGGQRSYTGSATASFDLSIAPAGGTSVSATIGATLSTSKPVTSVTLYPSSDRGWGYSTSSQTVSAKSVSISLYDGSSGALLTSVSGISPGSTSPISVSCSITTSSIYATITWTYGPSSNGFNFNGGTVSLYCSQIVIAQTSTSSTSAAFNARLRGADLPSTGAISIWRLGAYSDAIGWPTCGTWHEGRLWLAGVYPNRIDGSVSNDPFNFAPSSTAGTVADSSAINYTFNSPDVSPVFWLEPDLQGLIAGTKTGEWLVQATTANPALTPTNIKATRSTAVGCSEVLPVRTDQALIFVQNELRKVHELFADVYSGKLTAPHLSARARHLTKGSVAQLAFQKEVAPVVWVRTSAGELVGCSYKRTTMTTAANPDINGWHRHDLGSGRSVEWISTGPGTSGALNSLALVTSNSAGMRHVEVLAQIPEETDAIGVGLLLDNAIAPTSVAQATVGGTTGVRLNGLWPHNGQTVAVTVGGADAGDFLVEAGSVFVPYGGGVAGSSGTSFVTPDLVASATIWVGFTFTSQGQLLRPQDIDNQTGFAKTRRAHQFGIQLDRTASGISIGTDFNKMRPVKLQKAKGTPYGHLELYSGVLYDTLEDSYSLDSQVAWEISRPRPATVVALGGFEQASGR